MGRGGALRTSNRFPGRGSWGGEGGRMKIKGALERPQNFLNRSSQTEPGFADVLRMKRLRYLATLINSPH